MIAIPAIDLREGACVQLVGGSYDRERVRLADPVAVARGFHDAGFSRLHVVDLDAATGTGMRTNASIVRDIVCAAAVECQVGGGVRDSGRIDELFGGGAARVVVGTRALEDPDWLDAQAARFPDRLLVAADVRGGQVLVQGWTRAIDTPFDSLLDALDRLPLAGVLVTAVHVEGRMEGPDLALMERVRARLRLPLIASGGIATLDHLAQLEDRGVDGCVVGMALYMGALDANRVAERYGGQGG
jgi:phosphoribosylformimino-5-aminoimidazole carboxamide ribotide isomerase